LARRPSNTTGPERPFHTVEEKRQDITRLLRRIDELESFDPTQVCKRFSDPNVTSLETSIASTLASVFGERTVEYHRYASAASLDHGGINMTPDWIEARGGSCRNEVAEAQQYITEGKDSALALLRQAVQSLEEEVEFAPPIAVAPNKGVPTPARSADVPNKVFVVHGHDDSAKEALARFLEKLDLEAIILNEQPDLGRTIIEKFETYANQVGFAVVLLTPDDLGAVKQARSWKDMLAEKGRRRNAVRSVRRDLFRSRQPRRLEN
jgi:Predicted nucleotide-binding protein containing TIR-like domain